MNENKISIRVWGDHACFTRPEMKVERVSYPVMTPSAARGILEAIFWKPEIYYLIDSIKVIRKGIWTSFRRNEVIKKISLSQAKSAMRGAGEISLISAGGGAADATQRNMLALRDVEYIITAEIRLSKLGGHSGQNLRKYLEEFQRRARAGKCFHRPSLGVREFAADFDWIDDPAKFQPETLWNEDLGLMLYDVFSHEERATGFRFIGTEELADGYVPFIQSEGKKKERRPSTDGRLVAPAASFFRAQINDSVMNCHPDRIEIIQQKEAQN